MASTSIGKILIVDDEVELKNILVEALASQGYETSGFTSGEDALTAFRTEAFDVLLTDLMMPGMDGITLVGEALKIDPHVVPIVMTGQGTIQTAVDAMKGGAFDYVLKPFRLQSVMPVLTRAMNTRHIRLENLQLRETVAIYELSQTIAFTLDRQTIVSKLADAALQQTDADEVSILFPTEDGDELYVAAVRGENRQRLLGERVPLHESISSWVVHERTPLILDGEVNDERFRALWPRPEIRSAISIPMQVANKLIGTININALNRARPFTLGQMKALTILASTAAAALESTSLYEQVQRAEENYRSIFENAVEGIFQSNPEGRFITVNPAMARILGYDSPEQMIESITDVSQQLCVNPDDRVAATRLQEESGTIIAFEFQAVRRDGQTIWLSLNRRSVYDDQGCELYREGTIEDITERKRSEEALRASQQLIEGIINAIPVRVFWKDKNLSFLGCNAIFAHDAGLSDPKEIIGRDDYQLAWREHAELYRGDDREVIESGRPKLLIEETQTTPDGDSVTLLTSKVPLRDSSGEISGVIGAYVDITERKRTEEALRSSEAEMRALFASMNDLILVLDSEGRYLKVAPTKILRMYRPDTVRIGKTLHEIFPRETADLFLSEIRAALESGSTRRIEYSLTIGDGDFWFDGSISPMTESTVVWVARDITERKRAEEERTSLAAEIESQRQRLDNIVAAVPGVVWEAWGQPDAATQRINFVSDYVEALLGYTVDEWLSTPNFWLTIVHPDDKEKTGAAAAEAFALGHPETLEFRWLTKDGRSVWVDSSFVVIKDGEGHPVGMRGVNTDVSERKKAEADLHFQKSVLESQTEASLDGILVVSNEQKILSFNQRFLEIWKVPEKLLKASSDEDALKYALDQLDDPDEFLRGVNYLYEHTEEQSREEIRLKDGRTLDRYSAPINSAQGEYFGRVWFFRDITERKRSEDALRASQQLIEGIINAIPVRIFWKDKNLVYLGCNAAFARDAGFSDPKDIIGKDDYQLAWGDQAEMYRADDRHVIESGSSRLLFEERLMTPEGPLTLLTSKVPLRNSTGEISGILGTFMDITERKRLEEQRELLSALVQASPDFIGYADAKTAQILYINKHGRSMCGIGEDEELGELKISDVHPAWMNQRMEEVILPAAVRDGLWEGDGAFLNRDGSEMPVSMLLLARKTANGEVDLFYTVSRDITERKRAEEALRASEERYRDLVENAHDIIYSHDLEGNYTSVNKAGEDITGYTREETLKLNLNDTVAPEWRDKAKDMLRRKLAGDRVTAYEMELLAKDGRRVAVEVNTKLVYEKGKPVGVQGIARDVTERKQLEEQLRQSQKMEAIGQLAGGVAHDFNNLLTAINGYSGLALQRMEDGHALKPYLEEIKKAGDRAANLTRQLLAFGRKQILQPLPLNLNDVITDLNKMLRRLIGEDIRLAARLDLDLKRIKADPGQIEQVLMNLVVNARDAMPRGGSLTIETANIQIDEEYAGRHIGVNPGAYVMIAVSDTGSGMDDETQAKIFEPFFTTKEKGKGTGLGLSMVYGIVKQSGGNIWVYSEPGHGSTFKIYLPQIDAPIKTSKAKVEDDFVRGGSETVLLVEDEEVVRGLAQRILEEAGYRVITASGGEEAVTWCANNAETIHLLLTDVVMPETSGKQLAERLTSLRPQTKVLFMSGYTDEAIVHHGVLDSNVEFIQKPFTPTALSRKVRQVLDSNGLKLSSEAIENGSTG